VTCSLVPLSSVNDFCPKPFLQLLPHRVWSGKHRRGENLKASRNANLRSTERGGRWCGSRRRTKIERPNRDGLSGNHIGCAIARRSRTWGAIRQLYSCGRGQPKNEGKDCMAKVFGGAALATLPVTRVKRRYTKSTLAAARIAPEAGYERDHMNCEGLAGHQNRSIRGSRKG